MQRISVDTSEVQALVTSTRFRRSSSPTSEFEWRTRIPPLANAPDRGGGRRGGGLLL